MYQTLQQNLDFLKERVAGGLYAVVNGLCAFEGRRREQRGPGLGESFLMNVVRDLYGVLDYLSIEDPKKVAIFKRST